MAKSKYAKAVDEIQRALRPFFKENGFKVRGRTFNRLTEDCLTQVVNIQMGPSDPPGTTYIPGLRENLHGLFTINLGVYVPEVAYYHDGIKAKAWVQEYQCCIRSRLGVVSGEEEKTWRPACSDDGEIDYLQDRLQKHGIPFLDRFSTRDKILTEFSGQPEQMVASSPPRIVMAIIHLERGERILARKLLSFQVLESMHQGHREYVRQLTKKLELGDLDC